jgi:hypothetical protein
MTYEGIEFVIRAGLGQNEWVVTIHFPAATEPLAVIGGQGHGKPRRSNRADARSHSQLAETAEAEDARHHLSLLQTNRTSCRSASVVLLGPVRGSTAAPHRSAPRNKRRSDPTDFPA